MYRGSPDVNHDPKSAPSIARLMCQSSHASMKIDGYLPSHEATVIVGRIKAHRLSEIILKELIPGI
jgi:hypothetical protein